MHEIQVGVGVSRKRDTGEATHEALRLAANRTNLNQMDWAVVFFTSPHIPKAEEIRNIIRQETQCPHIVGCSAMGVLTLDGEVSGTAGLAIMLGSTPQFRFASFAHWQEYYDSPSVNQQLKETLVEFAAPSPLLFLLADAYTQLPYNLINALNYVSTHPLTFGGGACDDGARQRSLLFSANSLCEDGIAGLCLADVNRFAVGITHSCMPIGDPMFITEVKDNVIVSLDGYPALEVYATIASGQGCTDIDTAAQKILLGFPMDNENPNFVGEACVVRPLDGIDVDTKGLLVPQIVKEGGLVSLMLRSSATAQQDLYSMLQRLKEQNPETPAFGFYFNCAGRGEGLYGHSNVDVEAIEETLGTFPLIGFEGGFQFASVPAGLHLYIYTGVLVLVYS